MSPILRKLLRMSRSCSPSLQVPHGGKFTFPRLSIPISQTICHHVEYRYYLLECRVLKMFLNLLARRAVRRPVQSCRDSMRWGARTETGCVRCTWGSWREGSRYVSRSKGLYSCLYGTDAMRSSITRPHESFPPDLGRRPGRAPGRFTPKERCRSQSLRCDAANLFHIDSQASYRSPEAMRGGYAFQAKLQKRLRELSLAHGLSEAIRPTISLSDQLTDCCTSCCKSHRAVFAGLLKLLPTSSVPDSLAGRLATLQRQLHRKSYRKARRKTCPKSYRKR